MVAEQHPLRGILLLFCSLFFFAALDATAKFLTQTYSVPLLVWARYVVHCLLMAALVGPRLGWGLVRTRQPLLLVVRGLCLVGCTGFGVAALARMPLAETTAIAFTAPLLVALMAGPTLGERLTPLRWGVVAAGFAGVLLIARPGAGITPDGVALALGAASCFAAYQILTRYLAASESTLTMLFHTALAGSVVMTLALPLYWDALVTPPLGDALLICALGILGGTGHLLLTRAFRHAPASLISPFTYLQLVWATLLGAAVFGHWPDGWAFTGMAVIVAGGVALALSANRARLDTGKAG